MGIFITMLRQRMMQIYMERYFDLPRIVNATPQSIDALLNTKTQSSIEEYGRPGNLN